MIKWLARYIENFMSPKTHMLWKLQYLSRKISPHRHSSFPNGACMLFQLLMIPRRANDYKCLLSVSISSPTPNSLCFTLRFALPTKYCKNGSDISARAHCELHRLHSCHGSPISYGYAIMEHRRLRPCSMDVSLVFYERNQYNRLVKRCKGQSACMVRHL